jgi:hypothetical protein
MNLKARHHIGIIMSILGMASLLVMVFFLLSDLQTLINYMRVENISSPFSFKPNVYVFTAVVSTIVGLGGVFIMPRSQQKINSKPVVTEMYKPSPSPLSVYKDLFAQYVDPIGNLHIWRVEAERTNTDSEEAIRHVRELERFLQRHCDITLIGELGEKVVYNSKLYYARPELTNGTQVEIVAPGWKWRDIYLRYPTVR